MLNAAVSLTEKKDERNRSQKNESKCIILISFAMTKSTTLLKMTFLCCECCVQLIFKKTPKFVFQ